MWAFPSSLSKNSLRMFYLPLQMQSGVTGVKDILGSGKCLVGYCCAKEICCTSRSTKPTFDLRSKYQAPFWECKFQEILILFLFRVGDILEKVLAPSYEKLTQSQSTRLDSDIFSPRFKVPLPHVLSRVLLFFFNLLNVECFYHCGLLFLLQ